MRTWSVNYKGHTIRVELRLGSMRLLVDGELQDAGLPVRQLTGVIRSGAGGGEQVKASLTRSWVMQCQIFVDHRLVK